MQNRILVGLVFGIVVISMILLSTEFAVGLIAMVGFLTSMEYLKIHNRSTAWLFALLVTIMITSVFFSPTSYPDYLWMVSLVMSIVFIISLFYKPLQSLHSSYPESTVLVYIGAPLLLAAYLILEQNGIDNLRLLFIFIIIWVSDSAAYFVGSSMGKNKLFPTISPKKTWEGFIGGGVFSLIAAWIISAYSKESLILWLSLAVILWVFGTLGDLVESSIKRNAGVKDSGTSMGNHGGFLDRFDSFIFVWPFIYLLYKIF